MKKIIAIVLVMCLIMLVCGCSNKRFGMGTREFKKAHISDMSGNCVDVEIEGWYESDIGVELTLKGGNAIWCSEGTYILCKDKCPICDR